MHDRVWVWVGHMGLTERIRLVLDEYGDRITDISIFGWNVETDGTLTTTFDASQLQQWHERWPHIRFWGCFRNMDSATHGPFAIFEALRDSASARNRLAAQIESQMFDQFPWLHGVDIDLESGGNFRSEDSERVFKAVSDKAHSLDKQVSAALPPLTATGSIGGENWVRYRQLGDMLDVVEIMSYDFAWGGSSPGPISPGFWLYNVYNWAASQIDPAKILMGIPLYGRFWRIHDTPPNLGYTWRGISGTYSAFWQQFTGLVPWYSDGRQHNIGWLMYRDPESKSLWGYLHAYDWLEVDMQDDSSGVNFGEFASRPYAVRYGLPSGTPIWSIADNGPRDSHIDYTLTTERVLDTSGNEVGPKRGFTLTLELLRRDPVAATIIDDYATRGQLGNIYRTVSGSWSLEEITGTYRQYRGAGRLEYNHSFGSRSLYLQARFHFRNAGTFTIFSRNVEVSMSNTGNITVRVGGSVVGTASVNSAGSGPTNFTPLQNVLGVRVRDHSVRVYFNNSETTVPRVFEVKNVNVSGTGRSGFESNNTVWIDHTYLGDGWWYQPREAVEVTLNGQTQVMGRLQRNNVTWDTDMNMFQPDDDVDDWETIDPDQYQEYSQLDWGFDHWINAPVRLGQRDNLRIVPLDHDTWLGRIVAFDRDGGFVGYVNDPQAVVHWKSQAKHEWGLGGIAMWSLGQEDVRTWDYFAKGELRDDTKVDYFP